MFRLSNKVIQVCFSDGDDVLLHTTSQMITYTDVNGIRQTLPLSELSIHDCKTKESASDNVGNDEKNAD